MADCACEADILVIDSFSLDQNDICITCQILYLTQSCYIWIGNRNVPVALGSLALAMPTRFEAVPLTSVLINPDDEERYYGPAMAQRLSKKFGIQCFVSGVFDGVAEEFRMQIENACVQHLSQHFL